MMDSALTFSTDYAAALPRLPGQALAWLQQLRAAALAQFSTRGFPSPRDEEWRYTKVSAIENKAFTPLLVAGQTKLDADWIKQYLLDDAWSMVLVDGHYREDLSTIAAIPDTVQITNMAQALLTNADQLERNFGRAVADTEHGFVAFNTAWFTDGVFVHIPAHKVLAKPIQCLNIVTQDGGLATTRNLLVIDERAQAQFIETFIGAEASYLSATVTEVFVAENAALSYCKMQAESGKAYHFGGTYIRQAELSRLVHHNFAFGGLLARSDIHSDLQQGAECEFNGLYMGSKRQHIDNHTRINHNQPNGSSRETYKGVLADRARGVFQGRVVVAEQAQKTDSAMSNRNLLLSADAEADTKPQLEIYADDVKCSHGVTVGQLAEPSVFYLRSRGVDEATARNMLTFAFANEMVDKVKLKSLHDRVLAEVLARFPQQGISRDWL